MTKWNSDGGIMSKSIFSTQQTKRNIHAKKTAADVLLYSEGG